MEVLAVTKRLEQQGTQHTAHPSRNSSREGWAFLCQAHRTPASPPYTHDPVFRVVYSTLSEADITLNVTRNVCYAQRVIVSFRDQRTRHFTAGKRVKAFSGFERS